MQAIYYLPGHGGKLKHGLGSEQLHRGFDMTGRESTGEFLRMRFQDQIQAVARDIEEHLWQEQSRIVCNSYGYYLFLHAQASMAPFIGKVLLSPIIGQFSEAEGTGLGFVPPRADQLLEMANQGTYPKAKQCETHVGELDWQSNPVNVAKLFNKLELALTVVPQVGHALGKSYVSNVLDRWL